MALYIIIALLILIILFFVCVLNTLYKKTNHFNNQLIDVRKYYGDMSAIKGAQILNLGSNHPKFGFDYSVSDIKGFNCAVGPQTLEYDLAILKKITPYLAEKCVIIIPICLLKMFLYRQKNRQVHAKYYTFLPAKDIVNYSRKEYKKLIKYPLLYNPRLIRFIIKDIAKDTRFALDYNPLKDKDSLEKDAEKWIDCWNKEFDISLPNPTLSDQNKNDIRMNISILKEMLDYCKSKGFLPVLALLPVTDNLSSRFSKDFINNHILKYMQEANTVDAPLLNYLKDKRFVDSSLYINTFFFNLKGRRIFTKTFLQDIADLIK